MPLHVGRRAAFLSRCFRISFHNGDGNMKNDNRKMAFRAEANLTQMGKLRSGRTKVVSQVTGGPVTQSLNCPALFPLPSISSRGGERRVQCGCPGRRGDQPRAWYFFALKSLVLGEHIRKRAGGGGGEGEARPLRKHSSLLEDPGTQEAQELM